MFFFHNQLLNILQGYNQIVKIVWKNVGPETTKSPFPAEISEAAVVYGLSICLVTQGLQVRFPASP